jgi:flagellar basal-body rod protein FlgF
MDRMIYLSMSGAKATMQRQDVLANNLANASTVGFRAELHAFRAVPVRRQRRQHARLCAGVDGGLQRRPRRRQQHRPADGRGDARQRLARRAGAGRHRGLHARRLRSRPSADGSVVTHSGLTVLGDGGPIPCRPTARSASPPTARSAHAAPMAAAPRWAGSSWSRRKPRPLERGTDGLFRAPDGDLPPTPRRACRMARSKAATSARSRPWSP